MRQIKKYIYINSSCGLLERKYMYRLYPFWSGIGYGFRGN